MIDLFVPLATEACFRLALMNNATRDANLPLCYWHLCRPLEVFGKRLNMLYARIRNLLASNLLNGPARNSSAIRNGRPMAFSLSKLTKHKFIN